MNAHIDAHDLDTYVTHDYATNNGVRLHYAQIGEGPLVVMLHGFPHFWYTWRDQMAVLASRFHVVAPDLRGYNLSQRPHRETWGLASAGPDADQPPCPHAGKEPFPRNA